MTRYGSSKPDCIPDEISLGIVNRGSSAMTFHKVNGRYTFSMDEGWFKMIDPAGAGVIWEMERGLLGRIEIVAA